MMYFLMWMLSGTAQAVDLDEAYQREFAYLRAEREALQERLQHVKAESIHRVQAAENDIQRLQGRLMTLRTERTLTEDILLDAERGQASLDEQRDLMEATLFQADSTLTGFDVPEGDATSTAQAYAFTSALEELARRLEKAGTVRVETGSYFLEDGSKVSGQVVHVGSIANYGISDRKSGTLIPVGEGKLQLRDGGAETAQALASGTRPDKLEIFLHEGAHKRIDEAKPKTLWTWIESGGVVGLVIVALGFVGVLLALLRARAISLSGGGVRLPAIIAGLLEQGRWGEAFSVVKDQQNPTERVLASILQASRLDHESLDDVAAEVILAETPDIEKYGSAILIIAAVAPLLGLLGTVTGMIGTFDLITEFGTGDPRMLSGGISEALVTTQMGLIVAIPMLLTGNLLNRMGEAVITRLEVAALTVINRVNPTHAPDGHESPNPPVPTNVLTLGEAHT